jgi:hypothetical protein
MQQDIGQEFGQTRPAQDLQIVLQLGRGILEFGTLSHPLHVSLPAQLSIALALLNGLQHLSLSVSSPNIHLLAQGLQLQLQAENFRLSRLGVRALTGALRLHLRHARSPRVLHLLHTCRPTGFVREHFVFSLLCPGSLSTSVLDSLLKRANTVLFLLQLFRALLSASLLSFIVYYMEYL